MTARPALTSTTERWPPSSVCSSSAINSPDVPSGLTASHSSGPSHSHSQPSERVVHVLGTSGSSRPSGEPTLRSTWAGNHGSEIATRGSPIAPSPLRVVEDRRGHHRRDDAGRERHSYRLAMPFVSSREQRQRKRGLERGAPVARRDIARRSRFPLDDQLRPFGQQDVLIFR